MNINKINTIGFYGDSFTFGQYLDFYDYGLTECTPINVYGAGINFKTIKCKNGIHHHENHDYPLKEQWLYSVKGTEWNTDHIIYGDWYKRFNSMKIYKPTINEWTMIIIFVVIAFNGLLHL